MKSFITSLRRQQGFTLVELMVVVAIIGLLSAVAIPNFRKYQAKSKMAEAKLQLSAAYTAETSFFSDFNMYAQCLSYMGYNPSTERSSRFYAVGFQSSVTISTNAYNSAVSSGLQSAECAQTAAATDGVRWYSAGKGTGGTIASTDTYLGSSTMTDQSTDFSFTISAAGVIEGNRGATNQASLLTITDGKVLTVIRNGY